MGTEKPPVTWQMACSEGPLRWPVTVQAVLTQRPPGRERGGDV